MASGPFGAVAREVGRLFGGGTVAGVDEAELLRRFASRRDPVALEALVARHGPMVLGVCRRVLGRSHEADDAFQATFLVLVKKAGSIRDPSVLGPWLHGVAHRVAVRSRANTARRQARERPGAEEAAMAASGGDSACDRAELRAVLDDAIAALPERFRRPVVLCYLDGLTHDEAAERLRCPVGTVRSRLSTARAKLRERLARRGVTVPAGAVAAALAAETAKAAIPAALLNTTITAAMAFAASGAGAAAAGAVSAGAASLAEGVATTMILTKVKLIGGVMLAGALTLGVGGATARQFGGGDPTPVNPAEGERAEVVQREPTTLQELKEDLTRLQRQLDENRRNQEQLAFDAQRLESEVKAARERVRQAVKLAAESTEAPKADPPPRGAGEQPKAAASAPGGANVEGGAGGRGAAAEGYGGGMASSNARGKAGSSGEAGAAGGTTKAGGYAGGMMGGPGAATGQGMYGSGMSSGGTPPGMMSDARYMRSGGAGRAGVAGGAGMMGMGGANAGMMGGRPANNIMQSVNYAVYQKPGTNRVFVYNDDSGDWSPYAAPEGTTVTPMVNNGVLLALVIEGEAIRQLPVYNGKSFAWDTLDLKTPAEGPAVPYIFTDMVAYVVGNRVHAYSGSTRKWDSIELEQDAKPVPTLMVNRLVVEHKDHVYTFSGKSGRWSGFDTKAGKVITPEEK